MLTRLALAFFLTASPALAQSPMNAEEFAAYTTGKTITYDYGGGLLGTEQYLANRQVRWAFEGELCRNGNWYQSGEQICFVYEGEGIPQCWLFYREGQGISATYMGDDLGTFISEINQTTEPLACTGPDVGV